MGNPKPMLKLLLMLGTDITDTPDTTDMDIEDTTVWVDTTVDTTDTPTMHTDTVTSERDLLMPNLKLKPKLIPRLITTLLWWILRLSLQGLLWIRIRPWILLGISYKYLPISCHSYIPLWSFRTNNTAFSNTEIFIFLKIYFFEKLL